MWEEPPSLVCDAPEAKLGRRVGERQSSELLRSESGLDREFDTLLAGRAPYAPSLADEALDVPSQIDEALVESTAAAAEGLGGLSTAELGRCLAEQNIYADHLIESRPSSPDSQACSREAMPQIARIPKGRGAEENYYACCASASQSMSSIAQRVQKKIDNASLSLSQQPPPSRFLDPTRDADIGKLLWGRHRSLIWLIGRHRIIDA